jgi:hypothetical protein
MTTTVSKFPSRLRYAATGFAAAVVVAIGALAATPAHADNGRHHGWDKGGWDRHHDHHYAPHYYGPRVVYEPPRYYYAPPPRIVYAPPPVIYEAPPSFNIVVPLNLGR